MITEKILAFLQPPIHDHHRQHNQQNVSSLSVNELQTFYFIIKTKTLQSISVKLFKAR